MALLDDLLEEAEEEEELLVLEDSWAAAAGRGDPRCFFVFGLFLSRSFFLNLFVCITPGIVPMRTTRIKYA